MFTSTIMRVHHKLMFSSSINSLGLYLSIISFKVMILAYISSSFVIGTCKKVMTSLFQDSKQAAEELAKRSKGSHHYLS